MLMPIFFAHLLHLLTLGIGQYLAYIIARLAALNGQVGHQVAALSCQCPKLAFVTDASLTKLSQRFSICLHSFPQVCNPGLGFFHRHFDQCALLGRKFKVIRHFFPVLPFAFHPFHPFHLSGTRAVMASFPPSFK